MPVWDNTQEIAVSPYVKVYVANLGNLKIIISIASVIDITTNSITDTVAAGKNLHKIAIGSKKYKDSKRWMKYMSYKKLINKIWRNILRRRSDE